MAPKKELVSGSGLKEKEALKSAKGKEKELEVGKEKDTEMEASESTEETKTDAPSTSATSKEEKPSESKEAPQKVVYELNAKVLCRYKDNLLYEAKIIGIDDVPEKGTMYTVHYQGWNSRHDERISIGDIEYRFLPWTEENLEQARIEMLEARGLEKKKKSRRFPGLVDDKKSGGTDSRSSTPSDRPSRPPSVASMEKIGGRRSKLGVGLEEDDISSDTDISIEIPESLKEILVEDSDMVTRQGFLAVLPVHITIDEIMKQYEEYIDVLLEDDDELLIEHGLYDVWMSKETIKEVSLGIRDLFDTTLGSRLLYKFEMPQHEELFQRKIKELNAETDAAASSEDEMNSLEESTVLFRKKWRPSDTYGFVHLLRLFVKFGNFLSVAQWEQQGERSVHSIVEHVKKFMSFLEENRGNYFDVQRDYILSSPDYQRNFVLTPGPL